MMTYKYYNLKHITIKSVPNPTNTSSFFKSKFHKIRIFTPFQLILLLIKDIKDLLKYLENSQILTGSLSKLQHMVGTLGAVNHTTSLIFIPYYLICCLPSLHHVLLYREIHTWHCSPFTGF